MTPNAPKNATTQKRAKAAELPVEAESVVMLLAMVGVACSTGGIDPSLALVGELPSGLTSRLSGSVVGIDLSLALVGELPRRIQ